MNIHRSTRLLFAALLLGITGLVGLAPAGAQSAAPDVEFIYRFQPRDTLIQVSRRLLLQPQRWPEVQTRNHIANPFNIPPDTPILIPYSWLRLRADTARVQAFGGAVTRDGRQVAVGDTLPEGASIETAADGSITLSLADGSSVTLQKSSVLKLDQMQRVDGVSDGHSARLKLESGRVETTVKPKRDVGRFEISTPVAVSAVRGTRFRTGFSATSQDSTTETLDGTVRVAAPSEAVAVVAGFGTRVEKAGTVLPPVPLLAPPDLSTFPRSNSESELRLQLQPVAGAVSYRVQLAPDADFSSTRFDNASPDLVTTIPDLADGEYWLRVRAIDQYGIEGADAVRQLSQHRLPTAPALTAPLPQARVIGPTVMLEWSPVVAAARSRVQVARDSMFADVVFDQQVVDTTKLLVDELRPGQYYWRAAAISSRGESGAWGTAQSFTSRASPPIVAPPEVQKHETRFRWEERPGETYRVQIAGDLQFKRVLLDRQVDAPELSTRTLPAGTYYVRVQTLDASGTEDDFSEPRRFEVTLPTWLKVLLSSTVLVPLLL